MDIQQIQDILIKFGRGECTPAERELVDKWYSELVETGEVAWGLEQKARMQAILENRLMQSITNEPEQALSTGRVRLLQRKSWWAAAAVFIVLAGGAYFFLNKSNKENEVVKTVPIKQNDVAPGGNKAVLTLANGTTINLNDAANGTLANENGSVVSKTKDGELVYQSGTGNEPSTKVSYNSLSTPNGGQYQLVLPDGSKVWLNAASSIRYPTAFTGGVRKVEITGEAYFEIRKVLDSRGQRTPFIVNIHSSTYGGNPPPTGGARGGLGTVEVLGTHFNINAYDDEDAMKTTLLEGKVKVGNRQSAIGNKKSAILMPGEQAVLTADSRLTIHDKVDLESIMAWKNGQFHFEQAEIKAVMRQLARWYDVDIVYKNPAIKSDPLFIDMSRSANLSDVLKALEVSGSARFRVEGKKIIVL